MRILIERIVNGWLVHVAEKDGVLTSLSDKATFQDIQQLCDYIRTKLFLWGEVEKSNNHKE